MWLFNPDCVRRTMCLFAVIILALGIGSIQLSVQARESNALKLTNMADKLYLSWTFMTSSLFIVAVLALVWAWKNPLSGRIILSIGLFSLMFCYAYYGIKVKVITSQIYNAFETTECRMLREYQTQAAYDYSIDDSKSATYTIKNEWIKFFNDIYWMGRTAFCKRYSTGWPWKTSPIIVSSFYYDNADPDAVTTVQGWSDKLLGSYEKFSLQLNLKQYKSFFEYIGNIEKEYEWSGFWAEEEAYYFYDVTKGPPKRKWDQAIRDNLIPYNIDIFAMNLILISSILWLVLFINVGLFKKMTPKIVAEEKMFKTVQNTTNTQNISQISKYDDESHVSKF